jgi:hypothetical protein
MEIRPWPAGLALARLGRVCGYRQREPKGLYGSGAAILLCEFLWQLLMRACGDSFALALHGWLLFAGLKSG